MVLDESITTALDSIRANLLRSLLTTIAIVIGTASVIAMVGIGSSAQRAIDDSITNASARTLSVYPSRGRGSQKISADLILSKGFRFHFSFLSDAMQDLFNKKG